METDCACTIRSIAVLCVLDTTHKHHISALERRARYHEADPRSTLTGVSQATAIALCRSNGGRGGTNELIVVTILAAVDGGVKLPKNVSSLEELRTALNQLGSIGKDQV